eukprot:6852723-Alexandrium_andersonii.AAC.1
MNSLTRRRGEPRDQRHRSSFLQAHVERSGSQPSTPPSHKLQISCLTEQEGGAASSKAGWCAAHTRSGADANG